MSSCAQQLAEYRLQAAKKYQQQSNAKQEDVQEQPKRHLDNNNNQDTNNKKKWYIYVLKCSQDKYYIGKTRDVDRRFLQHISDGEEKIMLPGAAWTKLYEPLEIVKSFEMKSPHDEETTTVDLMMQKGIENVRGGPFCAVRLPTHQFMTLKQRLASLQDLCYKCSKPGHFIANCPSRKINK